MKQNKQVILEFTPKAYESLQLLKDHADIQSTPEIIRRALRLYQWHLQKKAEGNNFYLENDGNWSSVDFMGLV